MGMITAQNVKEHIHVGVQIVHRRRDFVGRGICSSRLDLCFVPEDVPSPSCIMCLTIPLIIWSTHELIYSCMKSQVRKGSVWSVLFYRASWSLEPKQYTGTFKTLNRTYLVCKICVVLYNSSVVSGCPHKILHHILLLRQAAIKLKWKEERKNRKKR